MIGVDADLRAESDGLRLRVDGSGSVLTCRLDGAPANIFETLRRSGRLLGTFRLMVPVLTRSGLRLDVVVGSRRVASAGSGVRQNALARMLRLPGVRIG